MRGNSFFGGELEMGCLNNLRISEVVKEGKQEIQRDTSSTLSASHHLMETST